MFTDNSFTADSIAVHGERLLLMQQNFTLHSSAFVSMNPEPLLWAPDCHSEYNDKRYTTSHLDAQAKATTTAARLAFQALKRDYTAVRVFARKLYSSDREKMEAHKLTIPYPTKQFAQLELVSSLLKEQAQRVTANDSLPIPPALIARLTQSFEAAKLALNTRSIAQTEANRARLLLNDLYKTDIQNLKLLYSFATAVWQADDIRFNDLGFARPEQTLGGGKNSLPKIPTNLRFNGANTLEWSAVPGATSYNIFTSDDGNEWTSDISTPTNSAIVRTEVYGKVFYKVRARNANGLGEFSSTYERLFGLASPDEVVYDLGELSWEEVEFATSYEAERAPSGTSNYARIYTGNDTIARDTPPNGSWIYRVRGVHGSIKGEWAEVGV